MARMPISVKIAVLLVISLSDAAPAQESTILSKIQNGSLLKVLPKKNAIIDGNMAKLLEKKALTSDTPPFIKLKGYKVLSPDAEKSNIMKILFPQKQFDNWKTTVTINQTTAGDLKKSDRFVEVADVLLVNDPMNVGIDLENDINETDDISTNPSWFDFTTETGGFATKTGKINSMKQKVLMTREVQSDHVTISSTDASVSLVNTEVEALEDSTIQLQEMTTEQQPRSENAADTASNTDDQNKHEEASVTDATLGSVQVKSADDSAPNDQVTETASNDETKKLQEKTTTEKEQAVGMALSANQTEQPQNISDVTVQESAPNAPNDQQSEISSASPTSETTEKEQDVGMAFSEVQTEQPQKETATDKEQTVGMSLGDNQTEQPLSISDVTVQESATNDQQNVNPSASSTPETTEKDQVLGMALSEVQTEQPQKETTTDKEQTVGMSLGDNQTEQPQSISDVTVQEPASNASNDQQNKNLSPSPTSETTEKEQDAQTEQQQKEATTHKEQTIGMSLGDNQTEQPQNISDVTVQESAINDQQSVNPSASSTPETTEKDQVLGIALNEVQTEQPQKEESASNDQQSEKISATIGKEPALGMALGEAETDKSNVTESSLNDSQNEKTSVQSSTVETTEQDQSLGEPLSVTDGQVQTNETSDGIFMKGQSDSHNESSDTTEQTLGSSLNTPTNDETINVEPTKSPTVEATSEPRDFTITSNSPELVADQLTEKVEVVKLSTVKEETVGRSQNKAVEISTETIPVESTVATELPTSTELSTKSVETMTATTTTEAKLETTSSTPVDRTPTSAQSNSTEVAQTTAKSLAKKLSNKMRAKTTKTPDKTESPLMASFPTADQPHPLLTRILLTAQRPLQMVPFFMQRNKNALLPPLLKIASPVFRRKKNVKRSAKNSEEVFVSPKPYEPLCSTADSTTTKRPSLIERYHAMDSGERAEKVSKVLEKIMHGVTIAGHVDGYLANRAKSSIKKIHKLFATSEETN